VINDRYICNVAFSMIMISQSSLHFTLLQNESSYKHKYFCKVSFIFINDDNIK
jgi:hypothetical protein